MTDKNKDNEKDKKCIVIEGVTQEGETFHPRDWAERVSGSLSTFRNRRIIYSPLLRPAVKNGNKCIIVDDELKDSHPALYQSIIEFAKKNNLVVKPEGNDKEK